MSVFKDRTEESSAMQYFQFYGYLSQQQNMMQDYIRTSTYQKAIISNMADFRDKVVLDVGAGSGILSFFAQQAGAKGSSFKGKDAKKCDGNTWGKSFGKGSNNLRARAKTIRAAPSTASSTTRTRPKARPRNGRPPSSAWWENDMSVQDN